MYLNEIAKNQHAVIKTCSNCNSNVMKINKYIDKLNTAEKRSNEPFFFFFTFFHWIKKLSYDDWVRFFCFLITNTTTKTNHEKWWSIVGKRLRRLNVLGVCKKFFTFFFLVVFFLTILGTDTQIHTSSEKNTDSIRNAGLELSHQSEINHCQFSSRVEAKPTLA